MSFNGVEVQGYFFVGVGGDRCGDGAVGGVGRDDGLKTDLLHLLQPAPLPEVRVSRLAAEEGPCARCAEGAVRVLPDDAGPRLSQGVRHGVDVLLWEIGRASCRERV